MQSGSEVRIRTWRGCPRGSSSVVKPRSGQKRRWHANGGTIAVDGGRFYNTLIHLISIPVTNTSVNPARRTGPAVIVGGWALAQLWLFRVAPILGAAAGGIVYRWLGKPANT